MGSQVDGHAMRGAVTPLSSGIDGSAGFPAEAPQPSVEALTQMLASAKAAKDAAAILRCSADLHAALRPEVTHRTTVLKLLLPIHRPAIGAVRYVAACIRDDVEVLVACSKAALRWGTRDEAVGMLDAALAVEDAPPADLAALTATLRAAGQPSRALAVVTDALGRHPDNGDLHTALGQSYAALGDDRSADTAYRRAVEVDPLQVPAWLGLADIHAKHASHTIALATIRRARASGVDDQRVLRKEFDLLREMGLDGEAEAVLAECFGRHRPDVFWQSRRIGFLIDHGRYDEAAAQTAALDRTGGQSRLTAALFEGRLAEAQFRLVEAREAFERALEVDERHGPAHSGLGRVHLALLDPLASRRHLARSKQLAREAKPDGRGSLNPSQSLEGQLMMECWSNMQAAQAGREALEAGSTAAMFAAIMAEPDYTPAAIAILARLRRDGLMRTKPAAAVAEQAIPRTVMQYWHDPAPPADVADLVATWRTAYAQGDHTLFDDRSARAFLRSLDDPRLERAFRACVSPTKKADLLRLVWLHECGGVYADADDRCTGDVFAVIEGRSLILAQEARGSIGNNFCAAIPGHPLIARILEAAVTAILRGDSDSVWLATGPGLWTREFARYLAEDDGRLVELGTSIAILERFEQRAFCAMACKVTYKTESHWMKSEFSVGATASSGRKALSRPLHGLT